MKRYRTKDLAISVLPESGLEDCFLGTNICLHPTGGVCPLDATLCPGGTRFCPGATQLCGGGGITVGCPNQTRLCPPGTLGCGRAHSFPIPPLQGQGPMTVRRPEELEQLKDDLRTTLEELEQVDPDRLRAGASGVSSREEAEELESRLESALEEVRAQKKKLG